MPFCICSEFTLSCVGSGLASEGSPVQGVLPTVYKIRNFITNSELEQTRQPNPSREKKNVSFLVWPKTNCDVT
jgi:hypothetical protein